MEKNTIKAFTLVEMLIVIVIIGILIASLMPRMQSAQGRARDVARKNDLAQIQTAIITSQQDKGVWPSANDASIGMAISGNIVTTLQNAGMTQVPTDPNGSNVVVGIGASGDKLNSLAPGAYGYMVTKRNSVEKGGFVLMAKTEVEGSSNWIVCPTITSSCSISSATNASDAALGCGWFSGDSVNGPDLKNVKTCTSFNKNAGGTSDPGCKMVDGVCNYTDEGQLAYILVY